MTGQRSLQDHASPLTPHASRLTPHTAPRTPQRAPRSAQRAPHPAHPAPRTPSSSPLHQGLILNNYATADSLAFLARVGIGASIIFSFPLNFVGLREGVLGMLGLKEQANKPSVHWITTIALMCVTNGVALVLKDLGLIVALGGAILGSALVYIFPALMAVYEKGGATGSLEKKFNVFLTGLGVFLAGLGAKMCLA